MPGDQSTSLTQQHSATAGRAVRIGNYPESRHILARSRSWHQNGRAFKPPGAEVGQGFMGLLPA
jgi:hypothetical protein